MCSPKTMLKIAALIAVPLVAGYVFFPQFRPTITALTPFALLALCPLGMLFGMSGMMGGKHNQCSKCDNVGHDKKIHEKVT